jgi:hypothetical protein
LHAFIKGKKTFEDKPLLRLVRRPLKVRAQNRFKFEMGKVVTSETMNAGPFQRTQNQFWSQETT